MGQGGQAWLPFLFESEVLIDLVPHTQGEGAENRPSQGTLVESGLKQLSAVRNNLGHRLDTSIPDTDELVSKPL